MYISTGPTISNWPTEFCNLYFWECFQTASPISQFRRLRKLILNPRVYCTLLYVFVIVKSVALNNSSIINCIYFLAIFIPFESHYKKDRWDLTVNEPWPAGTIRAFRTPRLKRESWTKDFTDFIGAFKTSRLKRESRASDRLYERFLPRFWRKVIRVRIQIDNSEHGCCSYGWLWVLVSKTCWKPILRKQKGRHDGLELTLY